MYSKQPTHDQTQSIDLLNHLKLDEKQIECYKYNYKTGRLGKGAYGTVYKGINLQTNVDVAIKLIRKQEIIQRNEEKQLLSEIQILKQLHNPNIVEIYDVLQTEHNYYIILEYCNMSDLEHVIYKQNTLDPEDHYGFLIDILNAFSVLVKQNIMHRDLKPANILVHKEGNKKIFKLGDFGFAKQINNFKNQMMESKIGTPLYMSPQILDGQPYTSKSDIWSLGFLLYQMIYLKPPWSGSSEQELLHRIVHMPLIFPSDPDVPDLCRDFIKSCLQLREEHRFSWAQIYAHPYVSMYFKSIQLEQTVLQKKYDYLVTYLRSKLADENELLQLFNDLDTNQNNLLSLDEFTKLILNIDNGFKQNEIKYIFDEMDQDGNGEIDIYEFKCIITPLQPRLSEVILKNGDKIHQTLMNLSQIISKYKINLHDLFRKYDTSKNNSLDKLELAELLRKIDLKNQLKDEDLDDVIQVFDENGDGEIQYTEFKAVFDKLLNNRAQHIQHTQQSTKLSKLLMDTNEIKVQAVPTFDTRISIEQLSSSKNIFSPPNNNEKKQQQFNLCQCNI